MWILASTSWMFSGKASERTVATGPLLPLPKRSRGTGRHSPDRRARLHGRAGALHFAAVPGGEPESTEELVGWV